jgi:hypothetical protein
MDRDPQTPIGYCMPHSRPFVEGPSGGLNRRESCQTPGVCALSTRKMRHLSKD